MSATAVSGWGAGAVTAASPSCSKSDSPAATGSGCRVAGQSWIPVAGLANRTKDRLLTRNSRLQQQRQQSTVGVEPESTQDDKTTGFRSQSNPYEESFGREDGLEEEVEGRSNAGTRQGWRGLATLEDVSERGHSNTYLLKKPWRKLNVRRQRLRSADYFSRREESKLLATNRDTNLDDLFKSLSSSQKSDRSSAVEKYFGRDLDEKMTANERIGVAGGKTNVDGFVSGYSLRRKETDDRGSQLTNPNVPNGDQRLKINLDLDLYRAKCLREEGRLSEAEGILNECIRDWPDDGRAYLAVGLLSVPLTTDSVNFFDSNEGAEVNPRSGSGRKKQRAFAGDYVTVEDVVEGSGSDGGTGPMSPSVTGGGERLKINLHLLLYQAKCLKQKGRLDASETVLRKCIRDWPDDGRPCVALGKLLSEQSRIEEARSLYDSGCQAVRGESPYIWQAWAVLEEKCGDISKARKFFDAATVADKKHVSAWHGWAKLELRAGNVRRARSLLNKGLKFGGSNEYIFQTLALLEFRDGKVEQARSLLLKATQHNPKSAASWLAWALMEAENNLTESARRLFQKGIEASPKNRYIWQAWALFEAKQGKEERARELFQRGRELNPKDAVLLQAFALFEYACGRPGIARDLFRRALTCDASHQPVWIGWGWMEWKQRNLSVARELYQGAIQADSRSMDAARAFQAWGVLEDREGDSGLARELFKCALKIDSQNVPTWMSWAAMEDREGRSVRADEIRNLFLQQRTEVVEGLDFSDLLAPAIDRIKGFFKVDRRPASSGLKTNSSYETDLLVGGTGAVKVVDTDRERLSDDENIDVDDEEFDVENFLKKKFPWKYGTLQIGKSWGTDLAQRPTRM